MYRSDIEVVWRHVRPRTRWRAKLEWGKEDLSWRACVEMIGNRTRWRSLYNGEPR